MVNGSWYVREVGHAVATSSPTAAATRSKPCSRSQIRSSTDSVPTESRTVPGPTPAAAQLLVAELAVRRAGRVDDQALRVADVRQVRPEGHAADQAQPAGPATGAVEGEHRAGTARQVLLHERPVLARREVGVGHVRRQLVRLEVRRDRSRVRDVAVHPQRQRLEPLQEQEGVERRERAHRGRAASRRAASSGSRRCRTSRGTAARGTPATGRRPRGTGRWTS